MADESEKNQFEKLGIGGGGSLESVDPESSKEVIKALELVAAISADLAQISRKMDWSSSELDELSKQISKMQQMLACLLSRTPEEASQEDKLYPSSLWLEQQFEEIKQTVLTQREGISALISQPSAEVKLSPYDDIDIQFEELKNFLEKKTSRWRIQENVFYGLVLLLLMINMALLFWLNLAN